VKKIQVLVAEEAKDHAPPVGAVLIVVDMNGMEGWGEEDSSQSS
jgi:hypothetical protein